MKIPHWIPCAALAVACSLALSAQQTPRGFHTVACIKVKLGKTSEYRKWTTEELHQYAQGRVDSGAALDLLPATSRIPYRRLG